MRKMLLGLILVFILIPFDSYAEEQKEEKKESYLCVADKATGFRYNKSLERWEQAYLNVEHSKYIVNRSKQIPDFVSFGAWEVKRIGYELPFFYCDNDFYKDSGNLYCRGFGGMFRMNKKNLLYIRTYALGYIEEKKENEDNPNVEIGKCSPF